MRKTKTTVGVVLAASVLLAFGACSTTPSNPGSSSPASQATGSKILSVATDNPAPMKAVIEAFKKVHPDIVVTTQEAPTGYEEFLRTALAAGTAADVIRTFPGTAAVTTVGKLVAANALVDLSDSSWASQLSGSQKAGFGVNGKIYSVPIGALALGPVYNETTLSALGVSIPKTFTEVLNLCAKAKAQGKVAYSVFLKGGSGLLTFTQTETLVYGPNPNFTTEQIAGKQSFAKSGWLTAFELQKQMLDAGCFNDGATGTEWSTSFQAVADGSAVATIAFSDVSGITALAPAGTKITIAPLPVDDSGNLWLGVSDSSGYGVNAKSPNQALAKQFLDFMASPEGQNAYASTGGAPALPNTSFQPTDQNQQVMLDYVNAGKTAGWPDQLWVGAESGKVLNDMSQAIFLGTVTPQQAVEKLDAAFATDLAAAK